MNRLAAVLLIGLAFAGQANAKGKGPATAAEWWAIWQTKHPSAPAWDSLSDFDQEEVGARLADEQCAANPKCLRVPEGGGRILPGETADEAMGEPQKQAAAAACAADPKCAGEGIARTLCENLSNRDKAKREVACRKRVLTARVTGKNKNAQHDLALAACGSNEERAGFRDYESFGELDGLVGELDTLIMEQKGQYKATTKKAFTERVCKDL